MVRIRMAKEEEPELVIQGRPVGSILEYRVSVSLEKYGWEYGYQVSFAGGRKLRGGQVIDFLVYTVPLATPLYVNGEYWHGGEESKKNSLERILLYAYMHGLLRKPEVLWGNELQTQEDADQAILKMFGRTQ